MAGKKSDMPKLFMVKYLCRLYSGPCVELRKKRYLWGEYFDEGIAMQFNDVVGHAPLKERLLRAVGDGRVPHAQLFVGARGTGNLALALAYVQYLMCTNRTELDSCGECPACRKAAKLVHPDIHLVFPVGATERAETEGAERDDRASDILAHWRQAVLENPYLGEAEWYGVLDMKNKQGMISTVTASEVIKTLSYKPYEGAYKVMLIWLPERMHVAAANKLLKIVEEPPERTVFVMVSENPSLLLKTITSRTQQVMVPPIDAASIAAALEQRHGLPAAHAADISRMASGSFSRALALAETQDGELFERYVQLMRSCYANRYLDLLAWAEDAARMGREEVKRFVAYAIDLTRNCLMLNLGLPELSFMAGQEQQFGNKFAPFITQQNVFRIVGELSRLNEHIAQNANAGIVFTDFVLKLSQHIGPR